MGDKSANKDKQAKRRVKAVNKAQNDAVKAASLTAMVERKKKVSAAGGGSPRLFAMISGP